ncbi:MAG: SDR family oxidoreductase, partial [Pseudomonadota bacterium]
SVNHELKGVMDLGEQSAAIFKIEGADSATDIHAREGNPDRPATVAAATPLQRIAAPTDIANAAVWIASAEAGFVSGTVLTVAGGLHP